MGAHVHSIYPNEDFFDLRPYQYGWEECNSLHSFGPFVRNHYLFHYILNGLGAGHGFLICPGQINLYTADEKDPWKYVWLEFDGMRVPEFLLRAGLEQDQPVYFPRSAEEGERLLYP